MKSIPKVLFLGCSKIQLPYLYAVKKLGFKVILTDVNSETPGRKVADYFCKVSYTDIDGLSNIMEKEKFATSDKIFTAASQFAYEASSIVAEHYGIDFISNRSVDVVLDKVKFYALLENMSIPIPNTELYMLGDNNQLNPGKIYYLKSDYGKTPNYCFRVVNGKLPVIPIENDIYYRSCFLLQEEVKGQHFRINIYNHTCIVFKMESDQRALPVSNLGKNSHQIVECLQNIITSLALAKYLVKFDIVTDETNWWVLDIGIDPPMRFRKLCEYLNIDFPMAYTQYYLTGNCNLMPKYENLKLDLAYYTI